MRRDISVWTCSRLRPGMTGQVTEDDLGWPAWTATDCVADTAATETAIRHQWLRQGVYHVPCYGSGREVGGGDALFDVAAIMSISHSIAVSTPWSTWGSAVSSSMRCRGPRASDFRSWHGKNRTAVSSWCVVTCRWDSSWTNIAQTLSRLGNGLMLITWVRRCLKESSRPIKNW